MSTMNSEVYDALIDAGADRSKAREAAKSVAQYDRNIGDIKTSLADIKASLCIIQVDVRHYPRIRRRAHLAGVPVADSRPGHRALRRLRPEGVSPATSRGASSRSCATLPPGRGAGVPSLYIPTVASGSGAFRADSKVKRPPVTFLRSDACSGDRHP